MELRTIFFNGPKGHRWVTAPVPSIEYPSAQSSSPQTDARTQNRRRFFGFLNAMRSRLERHGVTPDDVRRCYAKIFGVERMSHCSPQEWAIAAAEVQAMLESEEIFLVRVSAFKPEPQVEFYFCGTCYELHEVQGHGISLTRPIDPPRDIYCHACRRKADVLDGLQIGYGHSLQLIAAHASSEYYFSKGEKDK